MQHISPPGTPAPAQVDCGCVPLSPAGNLPPGQLARQAALFTRAPCLFRIHQFGTTGFPACPCPSLADGHGASAGVGVLVTGGRIGGNCRAGLRSTGDGGCSTGVWPGRLSGAVGLTAGARRCPSMRKGDTGGGRQRQAAQREHHGRRWGRCQGGERTEGPFAVCRPPLGRCSPTRSCRCYQLHGRSSTGLMSE